MGADLSGLDIMVVQIDGIHISEHLVLVAALGIDSEDSLTVPQVEQLIYRIENRVQARYPQLYRVFVRPDDSPRPAAPASDTPCRRFATAPTSAG